MQGRSRIIGFACTATLLFNYTAFASESKVPVLTIGPLQVGDSLSSVERLLGTPLRAERLDGFIQRQLHYPGLEVGFEEDDSVIGIRSTTRKYCAEKWLCPGMRQAEAARLAAQYHGASVDNKIILYGDGCWIEAEAARGSIVSVEMKCEP